MSHSIQAKLERINGVINELLDFAVDDARFYIHGEVIRGESGFEYYSCELDTTLFCPEHDNLWGVLKTMLAEHGLMLIDGRSNAGEEYEDPILTIDVKKFDELIPAEFKTNLLARKSDLVAAANQDKASEIASAIEESINLDGISPGRLGQILAGAVDLMERYSFAEKQLAKAALLDSLRVR